MIEIPLNSKPEQLFSIVIKEVKYDIRVLLNSRTGIWSISLARQNENLVTGVALLPGVDIFEQYNLDLGLGYVVNLNDLNKDPSRAGLGIASRLFILTQEEINSGSPV